MDVAPSTCFNDDDEHQQDTRSENECHAQEGSDENEKEENGGSSDEQNHNPEHESTGSHVSVSLATPAKRQVVDGWQPSDKSVLATGCGSEV